MENEILNILLVDDDADDRLFFKEAMDEINMGTMVTVVNDGFQLLEYFNQSNQELPDIIFLDINMPVKSGLECLRELRSDLRFRDVQIVIYSTSGADNDIEQAYSYGANCYLKKPGNFTELKTSLANILVDIFHTVN